MADGFFKRLFGAKADRDKVRPLYAAIVEAARAPHWYVEGGVEDSVNGRFEMVAVLMALASFRLEELGEAARAPTVWLAECFVEDMDGQMREMGVSDVVMGKHMGKVMSGVGGRMGAYRDAFATGAGLDEALMRNLYRGETPAPSALAHVREALMAQRERLAAQSLDMLRAGRL